MELTDSFTRCSSESVTDCCLTYSECDTQISHQLHSRSRRDEQDGRSELTEDRVSWLSQPDLLLSADTAGNGGFMD